MLEQFTRPFKYPKSEALLQLKTSADSELLPKSKTKNWKKTLTRIWTHLAHSKLLLVMVLLMVVLSSTMVLLSPYMLGQAIDHIPEGLSVIIYWIIALAVVYSIQSISIFLQNYWMIGAAQNTVFSMRTKLFRQLHLLPIAFFDKRRHGELMSRVTNDMENVSSTLNSSFIQIVTSVLTLVGILVMMLIHSVLLTLLTLLVVPAMVFGMKWITRRTSGLFKEQQSDLGEMNGYIEETLSGQRIVKTFSLEKKVIEEFRQKNEQYKRSAFWAQTLSGFIPKLMNGLNNLSFAIIAGIGGVFVVQDMISVGIMVMFAEYSRQFTRPLNDLANQFNTLLSAVAGAERVFEIMDEEEERSDEVAAIELPHIKGDVEFSNVSFAYEGSDETVKEVSFTATKGQTIAFVGPTGAGKTTLINLLSRFYIPDQGTIYLDGHDITKIKRESLRAHMAFVLQDSFLFEGTVRDNIRYGKLEATEEEIVEATKQANAHSFIMKLPDQYDTLLKHGGSGISQGQKQLLSIARAILANPSILILDEATSSIDTITEVHIQDALQSLMKGRTSFIIAHRLNTVRKVDQIMVLVEGRIIEQGSHDQLLEKKGFYAELYHSQLRDKTNSGMPIL